MSEAAAPEEDTRRSLGSRLALATFVLLSIASVFAEVRPFADVGERLIGHADTAQISLVALNILEGHGAVSDVVWLLHGGGPPGPEIRHPEGYWSIYQATAVAAFFFLFGARMQAVLLMASLTKAAIAGLGYHLVRRFGGSSLAALGCGFLLLTNPEMTRQLNARSDMTLGLGMLLAVLCQAWAIHRPGAGRWALCGAITGICIGLKPTGLLLFGLVAVGIAVAPTWRRCLRHLWAWALAALFALAPLAIHNVRAAGTVQWPDFEVMSSALLHVDLERTPGRFVWDKRTLNAWQEAAYDPTSRIYDAPRGLRATVEHRISNLESWVHYQLHLGRPIPIWILLLAAVAVSRWLAGTRDRFARTWRRREGDPGEAEAWAGSRYGLFVGTSFVLFLGSLVLAAHVHTETRYFSFMLAPCTILAFVEASRISRTLVICGLAVSVLMAGLVYGDTTRRGLKTRNMEQYAKLEELLPAEAAVMTANPWQFSFHLRRPAVVMPYTAHGKVVREVADRFGVEYLVVVNRDVRHPRMKYLNKGRLPRYLECIHGEKTLLVARFLDQAEIVARLEEDVEPDGDCGS